MNRLDAAFAAARDKKQSVFIPFLPAGDPDMATTMKLAANVIRSAGELGVPLTLEIGFPYSDPIADGAAIQTAYARALRGGIRVADIFRGVSELRREYDTPMVAMVSYSLVFRNGPQSFLGRTRDAGFDGVILPDLPPEEAADIYRIGQELDLKIIQLVAPTTPPDRAERIVAETTGFVYCVAVTGITGARDRLPPELTGRVEWLRSRTKLPIAVGFGVSKPEHVGELSGQADGIIVGSAIVNRLGDVQPGDAASLAEISAFITSLMQPLRAR
jgi:tryptophan synthase alpha chain